MALPTMQQPELRHLEQTKTWVGWLNATPVVLRQRVVTRPLIRVIKVSFGRRLARIISILQ